MRTKLLYVLVSSENDVFWEQTFLSIYSARLTNPDIVISLLVDDVTYESFTGIRHQILDKIDELIVETLNRTLSNKEKSRILKTNMRNLVCGDYLYIDSDTIVLSDLSEIDSFVYDIGAVYELDRELKDNYGRASFEEALDRFQCILSDSDEYFNSGVMLVKDTPANNAFFSEWNQKWLEGTKVGVFFDQPSLGCINQLHGGYIKPLDGDWNCQGRYGLNYYRTAKIFHYLYDASFDFPLMYRQSFDDLKHTGKINEQLSSIACNPFIHISHKNEIITGDDLLRFHSRMYSVLRSIHSNLPRTYLFIEKCLNSMYALIRYIKKRQLLPPR